MWISIIVILVLVVVALIFSYSYYELQKRFEKLERGQKKLIERNADLETHQLKFALQPHTLNNILANIKAMSNQISRSMESLSSMLEYIFYHGEDHFASVEEEVEFIRGYLRLQDAFSKEINNVQLNISGLDEYSSNYDKPAIPHLITAYLIENAFKHGDVNHPQFMSIRIELKDSLFIIEVKNKVRPNYTSEKKGIGLSNMQGRLRHLKEGKHKFTSSQVDNDYFVLLEISLRWNQN